MFSCLNIISIIVLEGRETGTEEREEKRGNSSSVLCRVGQSLWWKLSFEKERNILTFSSHRFMVQFSLHPPLPTPQTRLLAQFASVVELLWKWRWWRTERGSKRREQITYCGYTVAVESVINVRLINFNIRECSKHSQAVSECALVSSIRTISLPIHTCLHSVST